MSGDRPQAPAGLPVPGLALVILDGWGLAPAGPGNAIDLARTPNFDRLWDEFPHTTLSAKGPDAPQPMPRAIVSADLSMHTTYSLVWC